MKEYAKISNIYSKRWIKSETKLEIRLGEGKAKKGKYVKIKKSIIYRNSNLSLICN